MQQTIITDQSPTPRRPEPLAFDEMRRQVRARFHSWEFWVVVFDGVSEPAIDEIVRRHYRNCAADDFRVFAVEMPHCLYGIATFRKRLLPAKKLRKLLRRYSPLQLTERDLHGQDVLVLVPVWNLAIATRLVERILMDDPPAQVKLWLN